MPSVRIRRSIGDYSVLPDQQGGTQRARSGSTSNERRTLANLFQRSPRPATPPHGESPVATRRRASTSASQKPEDRPMSIVHQYCTQRPRGLSGDTRPDSRALAAALGTDSPRNAGSVARAGSVVSHGQEGVPLDMIMDSADARGAVGSALSLHSGRLPPASILTEPEESRHHHDDVVEHLSVIDNHISTVSNLSNVSNSIIIPNLPIYNRRPVVTLPTLAEDDSPARAEKGKKHQDNLDRHVEDVLTNRNKIKRTLSGFWGFITTPMGFFSFLYGFLCAFWGAAIVLFLAKMINLHNKDRQDFWVEISSQVENALFTVTGVGLIPWRVIDTYRIAKIWHYRQVTRRLRRKAGLPALLDGNDLPDPIYNPNYVHVLSEKQQNDLHYQQQQFMDSQTWYRPHETETHKAFPIKTALIICLFIDFNSVFQCMLCGCMWGLNRFQRPAWTTGTLIPASFMCGIAAGVFIWRGGNQTKKVKEVEQRLRDALDMEARGVGIAGYTEAQPTGEEFAVIARPGDVTSPSLRSPGATSPGVMSPGVASLGSGMSSGPTSLNAVPTVGTAHAPIGEAANRDPAVAIPAAPQPIISDTVPHPDLATVTGPPRMTSDTAPDTPRTGVARLPLLAEKRSAK